MGLQKANMNFCLVEQENMMNDFSDPIDFIRAYTDVYGKQMTVPVKVYLEDLPYYKRFEAVFLDTVLRQSLSTGEATLNFPEVEVLILDFKDQPFYDKQFYSSSTLILIKGIAILIDRVDQEVRKCDFSNIRYLYYYTTEPIDLTRILVSLCSKNMNDPALLVTKMAELKTILNFVNAQLESIGSSFLAHDKRLKDRMTLSEDLLGIRRVEEYSIKDVHRCVFDLVAVKASGMKTNEGYLYVMEFCSEYLTTEVGNEESIAHLKEYSNSLLDKHSE